MGDIELVIKIPEELYDMTRIPNNDAYIVRMAGFICSAIENGTPLPKGHGRLIDADALNFNANYNEPLISKFYFDQSPTIIEADVKSEGNT